MKKIITIALIIAGYSAFSQTTDAEKQLRSQSADTTLGWKKGAAINIGISQASLTNWAAGGQNSFSANGLVSLFANYKASNYTWSNSLDLGYGFLQQGKSGKFIKTDDKIDFTSIYGRKASKNWYYSGLLNFKTQMTDGFNYPNDSVVISKFLAPGYLIGALGMEYKPNDNFSVFIAPLTSKSTFVSDQKLADAGSFGVDKATYDGAGVLLTKGKQFRSEFGGYLRMSYNKNLMENVLFQTKLDLFTNYLKEPQNIDVNWENLIVLKVNKFITASISTQLIYDNDIQINVDSNGDGAIDAVGPRVQFKEVVQVGFSYKF